MSKKKNKKNLFKFLSDFFSSVKDECKKIFDMGDEILDMPMKDMIFNGNNPILLLFYTGNRIISFGFVFQIFCYC